MLCLGLNKKEWVVLRDQETKQIFARLILSDQDEHDNVKVAFNAPASTQILRMPLRTEAVV